MVKIDIWRIDEELRDHIFHVVHRVHIDQEVGLFAPDSIL
jgi:hypothetical protein